jgi:hypothetical protein
LGTLINDPKPEAEMKQREPVLKVRTKLQNQLIWMICAAIAVPTIVLGGSMYWIVARISAPNGGVSPPEVIAGVTRYIAVLFPVLIAALLYWVFSGTNKLVGPIERMIRELEQRIQGHTSGPIILRPGDKLIPLVDKINVLLEERDKLKEQSGGGLPPRGSHKMEGEVSATPTSCSPTAVST